MLAGGLHLDGGFTEAAVRDRNGGLIPCTTGSWRDTLHLESFRDRRWFPVNVPHD